MSKFYNYDARGASAASQIITLERMVEERDDEIERLRVEVATRLAQVETHVQANIKLAAEVEALRVSVKQADARGDEAMVRAHSAEAEVEALRKDAERYRWIRGCYCCPFSEADDAWISLDAAVDAEMERK